MRIKPNFKLLARTGILFIFFIILSRVSFCQNYTFSYTYQNITRINGGGTLEKGDIIEIRALMKVDKKATNLYYRDTIQTGFQLVPNSMKIVTNEGLLFRGTYTDVGGDDLGMAITTSTGATAIRVNAGSGASNITAGNFAGTTGGGTINPGDKPKFYGTTLFVVAYRLLVTANFGDIIYPTGTFYYKDYNGINQRQRFDYSGIKVTPNDGLCVNSSSASFSAESSFGTGTLQNRAAVVNAPGYVKKDLGTSHPVDGEYSVANNTSASGATNNGVPYGGTSPTRVFNVWDIVGDHTGAINPQSGNPPVAPGTDGGYMLVVNAAYPTGDAYSDIVSGLCPNTNYEFSAWLRNICGYCGRDSTDNSSNKPGVLPNLAFTINDIDYYNTGEIPWNQQWVKRGFLYKTGPTETSFKITIKNNAPGGGGNDWVLDDISLATCYPNLIMSPNDTAKACANGYVNLYDTVRSYFNNYNYYCWQKSTDGGNTWASTGNCGLKTPVLKNGMWEYIVDTVFNAVAADSGTYYRVIVGTTESNLTNSECTLGNNQKVFMKVYNYDCSVLDNLITDLSARKTNNGSISVRWNTLNEEDAGSFNLQKSVDGKNFTTIFSTPAIYSMGGRYQYEDLQNETGTIYYRIQINGQRNQVSYSKIVSLYQSGNIFDLRVNNNPFINKLQFEVSAITDGILDIRLMDGFGKPLRKTMSNVTKGNNLFYFDDLSGLPTGLYILTVSMNGKTIQRKLLKDR